MTNQCMARNRSDTARCERKATKMLATEGEKNFDNKNGVMTILPASVPTLRICGFCNRSLHSGSQSLYLELDDGTRHSAWVSDGDRIRTQELRMSFSYRYHFEQY